MRAEEFALQSTIGSAYKDFRNVGVAERTIKFYANRFVNAQSVRIFPTME